MNTDNICRLCNQVHRLDGIPGTKPLWVRATRGLHCYGADCPCMPTELNRDGCPSCTIHSDMLRVR